MTKTLLSIRNEIVNLINSYNAAESTEDKREFLKKINSYDFNGLMFNNVNFSDLDLSYKNFTNTFFSNCYFSNTIFNNCTFKDAAFSKCYFNLCELRDSKFLGTTFSVVEINYTLLFKTEFNSECEYKTLRIKECPMSGSTVPVDFVETVSTFKVPKTYNGFLGTVELKDEMAAQVLIKNNYRYHKNISRDAAIISDTITIERIYNKEGKDYSFGEIEEFGEVKVGETYYNDNYNPNPLDYFKKGDGFLVFL